MTAAQVPITDDADLASLVRTLVSEERVGLDTEFHRERTYYPRIALLQLAWAGGVALVDPLAVDLHPLAEVFTNGAVIILHASDQDLEVLDIACGQAPIHLFDTQLAAGFLGASSPSLSALVDRELHVRLAKSDRLTDWLKRPLTSDQLLYAASDVEYLLALHDRLTEQLEERGRLQWAADECEILRTRPRGPRDPDEAWRRIKEARTLRGQARSVAQAIAAWRERRAAALDLPVRFVLPDLAVVGLAQRPPKNVAELRATRGLDGRSIKDEQARDLLEVIAAAGERTPPAAENRRVAEIGRELRPAVALVSAWVSQLSRELAIDTAILATRGDLEDLLRDDPDARLSHGWRAELVGEPIRKLVAGEAALAFAGHGNVVLEARSHRPLGGA